MAVTRALPAELTIYTVGETCPQCLAWIDADGDERVAVDAAAVSDVDAAGVQLLLSLSNALQRRDRELVLTDPSPALIAACAALGAAALTAGAA
jgi:anti-anti-sigma regulatory factor